MKKIFLTIIAMVLATTYCFSQVTLPKKATTVNQDHISTKTSAIKNDASSSNQDNTGNDGATLAGEHFLLTNETSKAANMHWSCILFDGNNRQIASFQDNNQVEYSAGSATPILKMQIFGAATLGDFSKGGRLHIAVDPKGNESWNISILQLTLDFLNPKFTQNLSWKEIDLSTGKKEVDLLFSDAAKNPTWKYDIRKNNKI